MDYQTRLAAFETAYKEIVSTACRYYEEANFRQALAVICMANQMAIAFNVDFEIRNECFAMI